MAKFLNIWPLASSFLQDWENSTKHFFSVEPTLGPNIPALQVNQLFLDGVLDRYVSLIGSYQNLAIAITRPVQILACNFIQSKVNSTKVEFERLLHQTCHLQQQPEQHVDSSAAGVATRDSPWDLHLTKFRRMSLWSFICEHSVVRFNPTNLLFEAGDIFWDYTHLYLRTTEFIQMCWCRDTNSLFLY